MWKGKRSSELDDLYDSYYQKYGCEPDWYEEVRYNLFTYEEYADLIRRAIDAGEELPDLLD